MDRDYENYDYLNTTVKKDKLESLLAHYRALGWERIDEQEDNVYDDIRHLSWRRPHKIPNKDALQLFQVYIESAWNRIGKYERMPRPLTLGFGVITGMLSAAFIVLGVVAILIAAGTFWFSLGITAVVIGGIGAILTVVFSVKLFKMESIKSKLIIEVAKEEIDKACAAAEKLKTGGALKAPEEGGDA